jgi:hypothetical protein
MAPAAGTWLAKMLQVATLVQLPTTAWQSGNPERTIFAVEAVMFSVSDAQISIMAQGGFLQTAAVGTVTYTDVDGTQVTVPVTPDPSNSAQNPDGTLGWEDLLAQSTYGVRRIEAFAATGPLAIAKVTAGSLGPFPAGGYHVANIVGGATYKNRDALTVPSSIIAGSGGVVAGVTPGLTSSIIATVSAHGLSAGDNVYLVIPQSSGISGLVATFAVVTAVTTTTFSVSVGSSGSWVSGGNVYKCTIAQMVADVAGSTSSAAPGQVTVAVTQNAGVFVSNPTAWSGANYEANTAYMDRTLLSLASRSPNGPSQAYEYFAQSAVQILGSDAPEDVQLRTALGLVKYTLTNGPVRATAFSVPRTGTMNVVVASSAPIATTLGANVTPGVSMLPISHVNNANPAIITCAAPTTLTPGQTMEVTISGVEGISGVNGSWVATYTATNAFSIPVDTTAGGTYTGGGLVEGGDLGQIDVLIQRACTPDGLTSVTSSAVALPIVIAATVIVPQAYVAAYQLAVIPQLQTQLKAYDIGGDAPAFEVAYDDIVGALEEAGVFTLGQASVVRRVQSLSLNGGGVGVGVPFPSPFYEAVLVTPVVTVIGI